MKTYERENLRLTVHDINAEHDRPEQWLLNVNRISDGLHVGKQVWLEREPSDSEMQELWWNWVLKAAGNYEPEPTYCHVCKVRLKPDHTDTDYQFDNALWITFDGGYGMFVDDLDELYKGQSQWPDKRDRVVICHNCAHELCDIVPWVKKLLNPESSHSHRSHEIPYLLLRGHRGWDITPYYMGTPEKLKEHLHDIHGFSPGTVQPDNVVTHWRFHHPATGKAEVDHSHFTQRSDDDSQTG
jgi:hypothetical protein